MKDLYIQDMLNSLEPLTDVQLRQLWTSAPHPEVRRLLWEVRRLQEEMVNAHKLLMSAACGYDSTSAERTVLDLVAEPCIQRSVREQVMQATIVRQHHHPAHETVEDLRKWLKSEIDSVHARRRSAGQPLA